MSLSTLHIDADLLPYLAANSEYGQHVVRNKLKMFSEVADQIGAERVIMHVGSKSKGGREVFPFYQSNRKKPDPDRAYSLEAVRKYIAGYDTGNIQGRRWTDRETDDGLRAVMQPGDFLWSKDKDLRMVEGLHLELDPTRVWSCNSTGYILRLPSNNKVWGCGNMWFWLQMLMGDSVDGIKPIKPGIGPVTALKLLQECKTEQEAMHRVWIIAKEDFREIFPRGYCLWLRRNSNHLDFLDYIQQLGQKDWKREAEEIIASQPKVIPETVTELEPIPEAELIRHQSTEPLDLFGELL